MSEKKILVTGANGFLGRNLCKKLISSNIPICPISGNSSTNDYSLDLSSDFDLTPQLENCHTVIHCAGRAHIRKKRKEEKFLFNKINFEGTKNLAMQAKKAGVKKFILISSAGVMGRISKFPNKISVDDKTHPYDDYTLSKLRGEEALVNACFNSNMAYVILRPPLIYGAHSPGNWKILIKILKLNIPLPLSSTENLRSFIYLGNLINLIEKCLEKEELKNKIFLVSDNDDVSTSKLIELILKYMKKKNRMFKFNKKMIMMFAKLIGRKETANQLYNNLQLDITKTMNEMDWTPKYSLEEGIELSVNYET